MYRDLHPWFINSSKANVMMIVKIDATQWTSGLENIKKDYDLIGPVKDKTDHKFKKLNTDEFPNLQFINTSLSPKELLFSQSEAILEYSLDNSVSSNSDIKVIDKDHHSRAVIGIRPCDAKANSILQKNFDTPDVKDPYWVKAYETTTFIGLACNEPCNTCFCTSTGSSPYGTEGLDVLLIQHKDNSYLAKVLTEKGKKIIDQAGWKNLLPDSDKESALMIDQLKTTAKKKITSKLITNRLESLETLDLHGASFWDDIAFGCLNCGICTFACPTCWCFDIQDEIYKKSGVRMKNWDSCMFPIFTVHTTGHNPRGTKTQRVRQRFMHKLKYFVDKHKNGVMCVGCGRCIRSCPVNIDIRKVCELMNSFEPEDVCVMQSK